jgi:hypothetical protein
MKSMHAVGVDEAGEVRGASDAADGCDLMLLNLKFDERLLYRREDAEVPAPWAPVRIDLAFEVGHYHLLGKYCFSRHGILFSVKF